jgi:hypothetical protein
MKISWIVTLLALIVVGCTVSKTKLTSKGQAIEVLDNKPGKDCFVVAKVVGENDEGSVDLARNHARNLAAKLEADSIFIDQEVPNGNNMNVYATAYTCNQSN